MSSPQSDAFVFFGATGDLAYKKIFPALQAMIRAGELNIPIIGVARDEWTLEKLHARVKESLENNGGLDPDVFPKLIKLMRYVHGDYNDPETYWRLKQTLAGLSRPLHYMAIPPSMFAAVVKGLESSGCATDARIIIEKPFGRDLASAQELNLILHSVFPESAILRIDHYLAKEAVQNLIYFRFANAIFEPIWNRNHIDSIQITMAENFGVQGRGSFYEETGAMRDVVQNHLLQVTAFLAMEAPSVHDALSIQAEKLQVMRAMRPLDPQQVVRGQFGGYRQEVGVAADSNVETFAALRLHIDTWRWAGVPFYIRTGKSLPISCTEVIVDFKLPPLALFDEIEAPESNYFRFRLSPHVVIAAGVRVKQVGTDMRGEAVELTLRHQPVQENLPYARLLGDAIKGDAALFTSGESVEAAWAVVDPALHRSEPVELYEPGSWGPSAAERIVVGEGWHDPTPSERTP
jgi:glucose-6-phosphate 1-dehydrogenase